MKFLQALMITLGIISTVSNANSIDSTEPKYRLQFEIVSFDSASEELQNKLPILATIIDRKGSPDGGEYYLAELLKPIESKGRVISYLIVGGRMVGQGISPAMEHLGINIAYVTNNDLVSEEMMDFSKAEFTAIGFATASNSK